MTTVIMPKFIYNYKFLMTKLISILYNNRLFSKGKIFMNLSIPTFGMKILMNCQEHLVIIV